MTPEEALRKAADLFHKILSSQASRRLVADQGHKMSQRTYDAMIGKWLEPKQVEQLCADGFEVCVTALAAMGATDVSIHECGAREMEEHW